jgi:hypothetical protein
MSFEIEPYFLPDQKRENYFSVLVFLASWISFLMSWAMFLSSCMPFLTLVPAAEFFFS